MQRKRSSTGASEARAWLSEWVKRLPWRWIVGVSAIALILLLIGRVATG